MTTDYLENNKDYLIIALKQDNKGRQKTIARLEKELADSKAIIAYLEKKLEGIDD